MKANLKRQVLEELRRRDLSASGLSKELGYCKSWVSAMLHGKEPMTANFEECLVAWLKRSQKDLVVSLPIVTSASRLTGCPLSNVDRIHSLARAYEKRDCVWERQQRHRLRRHAR